MHDPKKSTVSDCVPIEGAFKNFNCKESYILAEPTQDFNCIGWAIGVKEFIDPTTHINKHYTARTFAGQVIEKYGGKESYNDLHNYTPNASACNDAAKLFFEEYKKHSVLPSKDYYSAAADIPDIPLDDTIAFYFKPGSDRLEDGVISVKGFQHAARYVSDVNHWVSDVWTSKLGQYRLMTHDKHELDGEIYGEILCYLIPDVPEVSDYTKIEL